MERNLNRKRIRTVVNQVGVAAFLIMIPLAFYPSPASSSLFWVLVPSLLLILWPFFPVDLQPLGMTGLGCGIILFSSSGAFIGDMLLIIGVILFFFSKEKRPLVLFVLTGLGIGGIKFMALPEITIQRIAVDVVVETVLSMLLVVIVLTIIREQGLNSIEDKEKEDSVARLGLNLAALGHHFDLAAEVDYSRFILEDLTNRKYPDAEQCARSLLKLLNAKNKVNSSLLRAVRFNLSMKKEEVDLHQLIDSILELNRLNKDVFKSIKFVTCFGEQKMILQAVPFELYFLVQNLISNAIESMLRSSRGPHTLSIITFRKEGGFFLEIRDTGGGFPVRGGKIIPPGSSKKEGGLGLIYISKIIRNYGSINFFNTREGALVLITFKER